MFALFPDKIARSDLSCPFVSRVSPFAVVAMFHTKSVVFFHHFLLARLFGKSFCGSSHAIGLMLLDCQGMCHNFLLDIRAYQLQETGSASF